MVRMTPYSKEPMRKPVTPKSTTLTDSHFKLSNERFADVFGRLYDAELAIGVMQRQLEKLGAPQYRSIRRGKKR
jgi:hypothetical protein